jgi:hypothetical protein
LYTRQSHSTQSDIGIALDVSKQAAWDRFGRLTGDGLV